MNFDPNKEESIENVKYNVFNDQPLIREKVSGQFQKFYDLQPNLKTSREELLKSFKSNNDESPFEEFQNRKIPNYLRRNMEGKHKKNSRMHFLTRCTGTLHPALMVSPLTR